MEARKRIEYLCKILNKANYEYYVLDNPTMLDFEYDHLLRELEDLEREHPEFALLDSPAKRGGGQALSKFEKVTHSVPLMSLQDVFSLEELSDFLGKIQENYPETEFTVEPTLVFIQRDKYQNGLTYNVVFGNKTPITRVGRVVSIIAQHHIIIHLEGILGRGNIIDIYNTIVQFELVTLIVTNGSLVERIVLGIELQCSPSLRNP